MRIGIDANILLRALLNDDPVQSPASQMFLSSLADDKKGYVSVSALLETFWVLRSRYRIPRSELHDTIRELLMINNIEVESFDAVIRALALYSKGVGFPDALLAERNLEAGCTNTHTLDRQAAQQIPSMELLA